ncbi:MAG: hypothetical protein KGP14_02170 [Betaproteobacteria bacterium]|nr:hypothetical protein [Betaproteobacteria bacterium]
MLFDDIPRWHVRKPFGKGNFAYFRNSPLNRFPAITPAIRRPDLLFTAIHP